MATPESCEPTINKGCISKDRPTRNNYFSGKHIRAEDLTLEQNYFMNKVKQMNSELLGYGVVNGLTIDKFNSRAQTIEVNPGIGVDSCGNVLVLYKKTIFQLPKKLVHGEYVYLRFLEKGQSLVARKNDAECGDDCCFNHIVEEMEIYVDKNLLTLEANNICQTSKEMKIHHKLEHLKETEPFLLIGQYQMRARKGRVATEARVKLHTNAELSKLLCKMHKEHVRSVNGQHGEITTVATINDLDADADGKFEIAAGNNITLTSDQHKITIGTKNGFHKEYFLKLSKGEKDDISHDRGTFPTVDVYRRVNLISVGETKARTAILKKDLEMEAKALNVEFEHFLEMNDAKTIEESIGREIFQKKSAKRKVSTVLKEANVTEPSYGVFNIKDKPIMYFPDYIYTIPQYSYEKVIGPTSQINVKVVHANRNTIQIENLSSHEVHLLVILNT